MLRHRVDVLAHPFRWFRRKRLEVPTHLYAPVAQMLADHGVAAEVNYHTNAPDARFYEECLARGVKISFASDTHEIEEAGEFHPHLRLLERAGVARDRLGDVLFKPRACHLPFCAP